MISLVATMVFFASGADPEPKLSAEAQKELQKLEGKWKVQKLASAGQELTPGPQDREVIGEFKGGKWIFMGQDKGVVVALDLTTKPRCMDLKSLEKGRGDAVDEAIYEIDGETLKICFYQGKGKQRPTSFDVPKEKNTILAVLKRVKE